MPTGPAANSVDNLDKADDATSAVQRVVGAIRVGERFLVTSHQRPDGDAIGSAMAAALALRALGKTVTVAFDAVPPPYLTPFPGVTGIVAGTEIADAYDAVIVMECSSLERTGIRGLDRSPLINIDHHPGNTRYGAIDWIDESAAACGELVFGLVEALGVPLDRDIATHVYLAVLTDTGSFHFSHMTPRTFEIARRTVEAGADPQWIARTHYDSNSLARVRIFGAVLNAMRVDPTGRTALLSITHRGASELGGTYDDTEGLINFPLTVKEIEAVAFFKEQSADTWRVSLRSKGSVDIGAIARTFGGGGHTNAAGCTVQGSLAALEARFFDLLAAAVDRSHAS